MFKEVPGYEFAEVNERGEVRSARTKHIYRPYVDKDGYLRCKIWDGNKLRGIYVHRAVAIVFVDNPENKPIVNHINSVRDDNRIANLEWVTHLENSRHGVLAGNFPKGQDSYAGKYSDEQITKVCQMLAELQSSTEISRETGVTVSVISMVRTRRIWTHISEGYIFKEYKPRVSEEVASEIKVLLGQGKSAQEVVEELNHPRVNLSTVRNVEKGKTFKHLK